MAPRPFSRRQKETDAEDETFDGPNEVAEFFSNDPRAKDPQVDEAPSSPVRALQVPAVAMQDHAEAGWYPDATDPGLMRYWDGFHLTGQVMHVHSRADDSEMDAPVTPTVDPENMFKPPMLASETFTPPLRPQAVPLEEQRTASRRIERVVPYAPPLPRNGVPQRNESAVAFAPLDLGEPTADPAPADLVEPAVDPTPADLVEPAVDSTPVDLERSAATPEPLVAESFGAREPEAEEVGEPEANESGSKKPGAGEPEASRPDADGSEARVEERSEASFPGSDTVEPSIGTTETGTEEPDAPEPEPGPESGESEVTAQDVKGPQLGRRDDQRSEPVEDEADNWALETERAVSRARKEGTPEAWQEAAQAAVVVSEVAQTMQATADALQASLKMAEAARKAAETAKVAKQAETDALRAVQETAEAAQRAAETAKAAEQAAADAKQVAERTAQATPKYAESASIAEQEAAEAERKAKELDAIVTEARKVNSPEAWNRALERATKAMGPLHEAGPASGETFRMIGSPTKDWTSPGLRGPGVPSDSSGVSRAGSQAQP